LGSIREVLDNSGTVAARYDYDPYGRTTKVSGSIDSDFLYTGHYNHVQSGLALAPFRQYSTELGRWLSRDPIGERGGANLYGYALNDPIRFSDPLGLYISLDLYTSAEDVGNFWGYPENADLVPEHDMNGDGVVDDWEYMCAVEGGNPGLGDALTPLDILGLLNLGSSLVKGLAKEADDVLELGWKGIVKDGKIYGYPNEAPISHEGIADQIGAIKVRPGGGNKGELVDGAESFTYFPGGQIVPSSNFDNIISDETKVLLREHYGDAP
jgi:RHS repeat-associated protein